MFPQAEEFTIDLEEEYQIVNPQTRQLHDRQKFWRSCRQAGEMKS